MGRNTIPQNHKATRNHGDTLPPQRQQRCNINTAAAAAAAAAAVQQQWYNSSSSPAAVVQQQWYNNTCASRPGLCDRHGAVAFACVCSVHRQGGAGHSWLQQQHISTAIFYDQPYIVEPIPPYI